MWTWWFWLNDRVDKASITTDLEALRAQGIGGVTVYSLSGLGMAERGPNYLSPEWRELWKHALKEADRLGLGVSTMLCSGWNCGGPWITPELACKRHVHAEMFVEGPQRFQGKLPQPPADARFYRDVAVQAFPFVAPENGLKLTASSSHPRYPVTNAADGDLGTFWVSNGERPNEGPSPAKPEWLEIDLGKPRVAKCLIIEPRPDYGPRDVVVRVSADGSTFTDVKSLSMDRDKRAEVDLPATPVRIVRLTINSTWSPQSENVQVCELAIDRLTLGRAALLACKTINDSYGNGQATPIQEICDATRSPLPAQEPAIVLDPAKAIDLTARCGSDGTLDWQVPEGRWIVVRIGCTLTGLATTCSSPTGVGLEADPLDARAMDAQFAKVAEPLIRTRGPSPERLSVRCRSTVGKTDLPNWTPDFVEQFRKRRGYDPQPYLAALAGHCVGNADVTDRFLYDYRKTVGECLADNYFGRLSRLAESRGIVQQSEAGGVCFPKVMAMDGLANLGRCAIPMGEFWQDGTWIEANQNKNGKQTASAAHLYGKRIAAAEAFTSFIHWVDSPASLKPTADRAFCEGIQPASSSFPPPRTAATARPARNSTPERISTARLPGGTRPAALPTT